MIDGTVNITPRHSTPVLVQLRGSDDPTSLRPPGDFSNSGEQCRRRMQAKGAMVQARRSVAPRRRPRPPRKMVYPQRLLSFENRMRGSVAPQSNAAIPIGANISSEIEPPSRCESWSEPLTYFSFRRIHSVRALLVLVSRGLSPPTRMR